MDRPLTSGLAIPKAGDRSHTGAAPAFGKRSDGHDEPIVEPDLAIVDAHQHFYNHPAITYMFEDYLEHVDSGHNIVGSVYVETKAMSRIDGPEILRTIGEVEFANGIAAMSASGAYGPSRIATGIVGHADMLAGDRIAELLDRAMETAPERFRGVRQVTAEHPDDAPFQNYLKPWRPREGIMRTAEFHQALRHLAHRNLSFDAHIFHHQLPELAQIADTHPDTTIVLDHLGVPVMLGADTADRRRLTDEWARNMRRLAERPNVYCKVGGLGLAFWDFGFDKRSDPVSSAELAKSWRPFVEIAVEAFGVNRCMMQSNFPVDGASCGWVPLWNALKTTVIDYTGEEKADLFRGTALRAYNIDVSMGIAEH